jgi:hypothetical protein
LSATAAIVGLAWVGAESAMAWNGNATKATRAATRDRLVFFKVIGYRSPRLVIRVKT